MKKNSMILLTGLVGVATLTGCFSDNGRTQAQTEFLEKARDLKSHKKAPGLVTERTINGERRVNGWYEYVDENGARVRVAYRDLGGERYIYTKTVLDDRSPAEQPEFEELHNPNPIQNQMIEMGEEEIPVSYGAWNGNKKLPKQNEGKQRD